MQVKEIELVIESKYYFEFDTNPIKLLFNAYDGYAYMVYTDGNNSGNGYFTYQRIKISDYSFDVEEPVNVSLPNISICGGIRSAVVCRGKCFVIGKDTRYIYIVDLANTADVKTADLGEGWSVFSSNMNERFKTDPGGTVRTEVYHKENGTNIVCDAIIYPDGKVITNNLENNQVIIYNTAL